MAAKLYIGGLSYSTTSEGLREFFAQCGDVQSATVITDRFSGQSRGFGFVEMNTAEEAQKAIGQLNGRDLDGRRITVAISNPQAPRTGGGRPGGGRGPGGGGGGRDSGYAHRPSKPVGDVAPEAAENERNSHEASVWRACLYNMVFLAAVSVIFVVFAERVVDAFTRDPDVAPIAIHGLRIISGGFMFYAAGYVLTQSFNGAGDTVTPMLINISCLWLGEIPLGYLLARPAGLGPSGAFWGVAIAFSTMSLVSALLFRRGRWKTKRV